MSKLISFDNTQLCTYDRPSADNPDAVRGVKIMGYPSSEECEGRQVCEVYITRHGDIFTMWKLKEYESDPQVKALITDSINQLKDSSQPPRIQIIVENGVLTDVRLPHGTVLDIEVIQIDKDYPDYPQLCGYRDAIYENPNMYSADFQSAGFDSD